MCTLCLLKGKMTIKERLSAYTEMAAFAPEEEIVHIKEVHKETLREYANELSNEVNDKEYTQLTFQDYIVDWENE